MKVREPVARPLDVVAVELLLSASQAFLVGVLMYLAVGVWDERGVGVGPVAIVLGLLGVAVGAAWLYWLLGGVGWPLAAADAPVAMFFGFTLVMGWYGEDLFELRGMPLLLALASAIYGMVGGVFIDSPRRWRWDQRQKLRQGTQVPRVSATTQALVAQVPRSLPKRSEPDGASSELATRIEQSTPSTAPPDAETGPPPVAPTSEAGTARSKTTSSTAGELTPRTGAGSAALTDAPQVQGAPIEAGTPTDATMPSTSRTESEGSRVAATASGGSPGEGDSPGGSIELPTSVEPKAQRSPWAWAAPPEWNRDEDDEPADDRSSRRT